ncbi:amidohydrolase [Bacillus sp. Marseille-P3661]|uniref:amidohydrolase n=1 Tax=Bacillus sp. Marseille-P3661 TaxID=1936234 RepID=UPI000C815BC8|nr:amidohydrolase [Bacillus sp. Marseille-P3661]
MYAITNAKILTISGSVIENGIVLIKDGKIAFVGKQKECQEPLDSYKVIDGGGRLVTPGIIDAHTHLGIDEEGIGWEGDDYNESSESVTPHMRAIDGINPYDRGFHDAVQAGITSVQVMPGSANVIGGLMACIKVKPNRTVEELIIRNPSGLKIALGENPKKFHGKNGRAPQTRMGVAALLREQFSKARTYIEKRENGKCDFDLRMEALALALKKEIPVRAHAHRADDIMTAVRIAKEFDLNLSIEHATDGRKVAKYLADAGVLVSVGPTLSSKSKVELKDSSWETYRVMAEEGIDFAMITDHPVIPIQDLLTSANKAVKAGLSEEIAWRSLTINPATNLGLQNRIGSIEVGKDADIVIWDNDPIMKNGQALVTFVDGEIIYQSAK